MTSRLIRRHNRTSFSAQVSPPRSDSDCDSDSDLLVPFARVHPKASPPEWDGGCSHIFLASRVVFFDKTFLVILHPLYIEEEGVVMSAGSDSGFCMAEPFSQVSEEESLRFIYLYPNDGW